MRTIIAGSRTANSYNELLRAIDAISWKPSESSAALREAPTLSANSGRAKTACLCGGCQPIGIGMESVQVISGTPRCSSTLMLYSLFGTVRARGPPT